jgi:hypothetical protein
MRVDNRERVQQETAAERDRLIKAFERILPEKTFIEKPSSQRKVNDDENSDTQKHGDE